MKLIRSALNKAARFAMWAALLLLAGCAAPREPAWVADAVTPDQAAECNLRASEATAGIRDGLEQGLARIDLERRCRSTMALRNRGAAQERRR